MPSEHTLEMTFALRQRNVATLEETLLRVSDPQHEDYGKHLDLEQVSELLAPAQDTVAAVRDWLAEHGAVLLVSWRGQQFGHSDNLERSRRILCTRAMSVGSTAVVARVASRVA